VRVIDCEQGSDVWLKAREGRITASRLVDVLNYLKKGGESQKRADYRTELVAERLTGLAEDRYVSPEMKWGILQEPFARSAYEVETGNFLDLVGFVLHPTMDFSGASPDGLYGLRGGCEFKCPKSTTHIEYMLAGVVPEEYVPQMTWEMACCERDWIDFVSYDPRMPEDLQLFICRLMRDEAKIKEYEAEVLKFEGEINSQIARLRGRLLRTSVSGVDDSVRQPQIVQPLHRAVDANRVSGIEAHSG
jgi:hypothetical protein